MSKTIERTSGCPWFCLSKGHARDWQVTTGFAIGIHFAARPLNPLPGSCLLFDRGNDFGSTEAACSH
jgi:hypothetical protein